MMQNTRVAYCTGFWCTNIGNGFFSLGVEYVLKKTLGTENVTVISDYQTYTTSYGKRLYPDKNQLNYIKYLDVDYIVLAGPVISNYFLPLWRDTLLYLKQRGVGYIILSAGTMKLSKKSGSEVKAFMKECPPYIISTRDTTVYNEFGEFAIHAYDGICFSFFAPDVYYPTKLSSMGDYIICNFDKINEPLIQIRSKGRDRPSQSFEFNNGIFEVRFPSIFMKIMGKTDRFTDAFIYAMSIFPAHRRANTIGKYSVIRTDQRFHPHYRRKIYRQKNSFCADIPYGYLNLYANAKLTLSDRVHACAVTLAFGNSAMLFTKTDRQGLLERVGANDICHKPIKLDMEKLKEEKRLEIEWLSTIFLGDR